MSQPEVQKFTHKARRVIEEQIIDKRARAKHKRLGDPERRFHEGFAEGLGRAVSILKSLAKEW